MEMLATADMAWTNFLGNDFSVEDLLIEPDQQEGFDQEAEGDDSFETSNHPSSASSYSAASFEPHKPSTEIDFHTTEDVDELEWVSRFVDDSFFEFPSSDSMNLLRADRQSSATPAANLSSERSIMVPVKARSKRSRTTSTNLWLNKSVSSSSPDSCASSRNPDVLFLFETQSTEEKKKRGRKKMRQSPESERKCSHCGAEKTPQWRAGPMGAKTLCNACGVRFKSGRLLPEYRPACSPTFVSSVHSNSHRKVLEMRRKKKGEEEQQLVAFW